MGSEEILNQDVYGNTIEEHKCEILTKEYKDIQFPEKMEIRTVSKEEFEKEIKSLSYRYEVFIIEIINKRRCIVYREQKIIIMEDDKNGDTKQIITELVDFQDSKQRPIYILEDFDKFVNEKIKIKEIDIFRINGTKMIIFEDAIYQEKTKEENEHNKLYC